MSVSIKVDVADGFSGALRHFDEAMQRRVQGKLTEWAANVKADAERLVPIRTGYLQGSIYAKSRDWQVQVGAEATYAAAVEFGTPNTQAKPYLTPAVEAYLPSLERVLLDAIDSAKAEAQL